MGMVGVVVECCVSGIIENFLGLLRLLGSILLIRNVDVLEPVKNF